MIAVQAPDKDYVRGVKWVAKATSKRRAAYQMIKVDEVDETHVEYIAVDGFRAHRMLAPKLDGVEPGLYKFVAGVIGKKLLVLEPIHKEWNFPDVEKVWPEETGEPAIAFNSKYISEATEMEGRNELHVIEPTKPAVVTSQKNGYAYSALVMPMHPGS